MEVVTIERTNKVTLQKETEVLVKIKDTLYFWGVATQIDKVLSMIAEANKWIETSKGQ
jgi:hypothetical protein